MLISFMHSLLNWKCILHKRNCTLLGKLNLLLTFTLYFHLKRSKWKSTRMYHVPCERSSFSLMTNAVVYKRNRKTKLLWRYIEKVYWAKCNFIYELYIFSYWIHEENKYQWEKYIMLLTNNSTMVCTSRSRQCITLQHRCPDPLPLCPMTWWTLPDTAATLGKLGGIA